MRKLTDDLLYSNVMKRHSTKGKIFKDQLQIENQVKKSARQIVTQGKTKSCLRNEMQLHNKKSYSALLGVG